MERRFAVAQTRQGKAIPNASVTVRDANGATATLYSDNALTPLANPVTTNLDGEYSYYAANGRYSETIVAAGQTTETVSDLLLHDPDDSTSSFLSVKAFDAVGDGVTSDQTAIAAAVAGAFAAGDSLYWPDGTYLTTGSIPEFHGVRHFGPGVVKRGSDTFTIEPDRTTLRKLYVSPSGDDDNDGLSSSQPMASIQTAVDRVHRWGPVVGRQQIIGAAGTYAESVTIPDGLAQENNYLEFKFPSDPGVRGDPDSWPAGGAILDGTGLSGDGFNVGAYNKVYIEYLLVRDWFDTGLAAASQVVRGIVVDKFSFLFTHGVSAQGNGWSNFGILPMGSAVITGGILDGARYSIDNTGGRLSLTADVSTYTTIRDALEYGLHAKHQSSSVLDFTEFLDNGQLAAAATYGAALLAYKSGTSIDTRTCTFKRNNIAYSARGGYISRSPDAADVLGTGADKNDRVWAIKGYGQDDLLSFKAIAGRDISQNAGGGTVTGATAVAYDSGATIPAGYLVNTDQYLELEVFASNNAGGTAQIRPSLLTAGAVRYELGNFQIAAATSAKVRLIVQSSSSGTVATVYYDNINASTGGTVTGNIVVNPIEFDDQDLEFQVWGDTSSTNVLTVRKARCVLWG